jgi:hypothetical protein
VEVREDWRIFGTKGWKREGTGEYLEIKCGNKRDRRILLQKVHSNFLVRAGCIQAKTYLSLINRHATKTYEAE